MTFGLTQNGFVLKRLEDIQSSMQARMRGVFGPTFNTGSDSVAGQFIGAFAEELSLVWELGQQLVDSQDPDAAEGVALRILGTIVGVEPQIPTATTGTAILTGTVGTLVLSGTLLGQSTKPSGVEFATTQEVTIASATLTTGSITFAATGSTITRAAGSWLADGVQSGTKLTISGTSSNNATFTVDEVLSATQITVTATPTNETAPTPTVALGRVSVPISAVETGANEALAYDVDTIINTLTGLDTAINTADCITGQGEELDLEFRARRQNSLQITGSRVDLAMRARIDRITGVDQVFIISNRSDSVDADGRPPKSFEVIVYPDRSDPAFNLEIARTIFLLQPAGIESFGSSTFEVVDTQKRTQEVAFSFATEVPIYVTATITKGTDYPSNGDELVKAKLLATGNALSVGDDVRHWIFAASLDAKDDAGKPKIPGIIDVDVRIGTAPAPSGTANIAINSRSIARFDSTRITVI